MVYQWRVPIPKVSAQAAGEELEKISETHGSLQPETVVDASRDPEAVLHGCFEWDDSKAAEGYRQTQAQGIIRNLVTVNVRDAPCEAPVRAFVRIESDYKPIETVVASADYSAKMLINAMAELKAFQTKYSTLSELAVVFGSIETLEKTLPHPEATRKEAHA